MNTADKSTDGVEGLSTKLRTCSMTKSTREAWWAVDLVFNTRVKTVMLFTERREYKCWDYFIQSNISSVVQVWATPGPRDVAIRAAAYFHVRACGGQIHIRLSHTGTQAQKVSSYDNSSHSIATGPGSGLLLSRE